MRTLLLVIVAALAAPARADEPPVRITHGPILGRLGANEIGVWTRTSRTAPFRVKYGTAADKLDRLSAPVTTKIDRDNTGWVLLTGLKANTRYHYRVVLGDKDDGVGGSFRTLPASEELKDAKLNPKGLFNFRFEFACGNNQAAGQGAGPETPAFKTMLERLKDKAHFAILNGDWLYEEKREYSPDDWLKQVGLKRDGVPSVVRHAPTIVGVWENYKLYLERSKNLAAWHREMPSFFTFDDHEILNDIWGAGSAGLRDRRAVFRDIGTRAWYDYLGWSNPVGFEQGVHFGKARLKQGDDTLLDPDADFTKLDLKQMSNLHVHWGTPTAGVNDNSLDGVGGDPNAGVYDIVEVLGKNRLKVRPAPKKDGEAAYSIGRRSYFKKRVGNCEFFYLDTRSHREMHDVKNPGKVGLSMLGKPQKEWLLKEMKASDADFLFVVSSVNLMVQHVGGGAIREGANKDEAWTVFLEEREQFLKFWDGLNRPVFVLTGDLHNSFAIKITDRVWEFASGPHNSQNHIAADEAGRPANGPFESHGRKCEIRWSSHFLDDVPRKELQHPMYCVVQVNNVYNNPLKLGEERWVAYPRPHVIVQYYDGRTGDLRYAESVAASR